MKGLLTAPAFVVAFASYSQKPVGLKDVQNHVGDTVKVCGKMYSGVFVSTAEGTPTFLSMGGHYPNQLLTVVIWPDIRDSLKTAPENEMYGQQICVTGKIELYKGKPEIVVKDPGQLTIPNVKEEPRKGKRP